MKSLKLLITLLSFHSIATYNISPSPNIVLKDPDINNPLNIKSSYFGFSIVLRKSHIMIGAPRANYSEYQTEVKETGMVYKCDFKEKCENYYVDMETDDVLKESRLLGWSMDGHENEEDPFVVCAPKTIRPRYYHSDYYLLGMCYYKENTKKSFENITRKIQPLFDDSRIYIKDIYNNDIYYYIYGESGFSVHITDDMKGALIGAVGVIGWRGTTVQYDFNHGNIDQNYHGIVADVSRIDHRMGLNQYLGYSVTSGRFLAPENENDLFYVASAPRLEFNNLNGSVIIYYVGPRAFHAASSSYINIIHFFKGTQFGSYYGYSVVCDDFNNDKRPDLVISAPYLKRQISNETGVVYVYTNQCKNDCKKNTKVTLKFKPQSLYSNSGKNGNFGMALGKIGDVNNDGYNDLAVAAPFEEDGAVYIFHGSENGLLEVYTQKIKQSKTSMFGYSISRGVDIDGNGFKDIAIGSPNSSEVFIFKSYPILKVDSTIEIISNDLILNNSISSKFCAKINSDCKVADGIDISTLTYHDNQHELKKKGLNITLIESNMKIYKNNFTCQETMLKVNLRNQSQITLKVEYDSVEKINDSLKEFCDKCMVFDRNDEKINSKVVLVNTGCTNDTCRTDMRIIGKVLNANQTIIFGTANNISIEYTISNLGEPAYNPRLEIRVTSDNIKFSQIPSICKIERGIEPVKLRMICINESASLKKHFPYKQKVDFDISELKEETLKISAVVASLGNEINPQDNFDKKSFEFRKQCDIEIKGFTSSNSIFLIKSTDKEVIDEEINYSYKILNHGPSSIDELSLEILIPRFYNSNSKKYKIAEVKEIICEYKEHGFEVDWEEKNMNQIKYLEKSHMRSKRSVNDTSMTPRNRTIEIKCDDSDVECFVANVVVTNVDSSNEKTIIINIKLILNFNEITKFLNAEKYFMTYKPNVTAKVNDFYKLHSPDLTTIGESSIIIVNKEIITKTPIWIIIASGVGGILFFLILTYILYKSGFFQRKVKKELIKLKRETLMLDLNSFQIPPNMTPTN